MKLIQYLIKLFITFFLICCVPDEPQGTFELSKEANKFKIDTTVTSFKMIDNNGITEEFYITNTYTYFHEPWENGLFEHYEVEYSSVIYDLDLGIRLIADEIESSLVINWNYKDYVTFYFKTKEVYGDPITPNIKFYDSLTINNKTYFDILEINYVNRIGKLDSKTPKKTIFSGAFGLIKAELRNGSILERK